MDCLFWGLLLMAWFLLFRHEPRSDLLFCHFLPKSKSQELATAGHVKGTSWARGQHAPFRIRLHRPAHSTDANDKCRRISDHTLGRGLLMSVWRTCWQQ